MLRRELDARGLKLVGTFVFEPLYTSRAAAADRCAAGRRTGALVAAVGGAPAVLIRLRRSSGTRPPGGAARRRAAGGRRVGRRSRGASTRSPGGRRGARARARACIRTRAPTSSSRTRSSGCSRHAGRRLAVPRHRPLRVRRTGPRRALSSATRTGSRTSTSRTSTASACGRVSADCTSGGGRPRARSARSAKGVVDFAALVARARRARLRRLGHGRAGPRAERRGDPAAHAVREPRAPGARWAWRERHVRLTAAQALVRYLARPVQRARRRAPARRARNLRDLRPRQRLRARPGARGGRRAARSPSTSRRTSRRWCTPRSATRARTNLLATLACTASIGPGATNLVTGAATATVNRLPVLLLPSDTFATRRQGPGAAGARAPARGGPDGQRRLRPVSRFFDRIARPEQLLDRAAGGDARAARPGRDRRGDAVAAPGRPGARRTTSRPRFFGRATWRVAAARPRPASSRRGRGAARAPSGRW